MAEPAADSKSPTQQNDSGWLNEKRERAIRWALIAFFAVMATGYNLGPILEGPDESSHYQYIRHIVTEASLPERTAEYRPERLEYHQPPLYYWVGAIIRWPVPDGDYETFIRRRNPYFARDKVRYGWGNNPPFGNDNTNFFLHGPSEDFPYAGSGTALATHLLRLYSTGIGLLTALVCAAIFRLLWPDKSTYRLLALGIVCAWPQFQYQSGQVNNDNLTTLTATWCIYHCLRFQESASWRTAGLIGLGLGGALITKASGVLLILPIGLAYALSARQHWPKAGLTIAIAIVLAGWWYVRNTLLYADPTGLRAQYDMLPSLMPPGGHISLTDVPGAWLSVYQTMWARFGKRYIVTIPSAALAAYDFLTVVGISGLTLAGWRARRQAGIPHPLPIQVRQMVVLAALAAAWIAGLTVFLYTNVYGRFGRMLLPGIAVYAAALAAGALAWLPERFRLRAMLGVSALMAILSVSALASFHAAYRPTPMPATIESARDLTYDQTVQLIGVSGDTVSARPGETAHFTLYWKALKQTRRQVIVDVHTYGSDLIKLTSFPGEGNWPAAYWLPDQYWAESYSVAIPDTAKPGDSLPITVYLLYRNTRQLLPIFGNDGAPVVFPAVMKLRIEP